MLIEHAEVLRRLWVFMGFYDSFMTLGQPLRHRRAVGGGLNVQLAVHCVLARMEKDENGMELSWLAILNQQ